MKTRVMFLITLTAIASMISIHGTSNAAATCTHYASPTGTGIGTSAAQPFKIANFWPLAKPGYVLCLLDGEYTGSASMINPPQNLRGTANAPITIRALNDGKVTIDGESVRPPMRLYYNDYFVLEGFNAHHSDSTVISLSRSNHNIVRRVAAWDAADGNTNIFGVHNNSTHNLLEDVAGWGIGRKIFSGSQGGNYLTIRRAWGRWEGSHIIGPKMTYTLAYNNYNVTCENCIGTWSGERMKQTYTLLDSSGKPWTGNGAGTYTNYGVNQPWGIFSMDRLDGDENARSKILGSIAYVRRSDRFAADNVVFISEKDSFEVTNTAVYIEPGTYTAVRPFGLFNLESGALNLSAKNLTSIGTEDSYFASDWKTTSISEGNSLSSVANVYTSTSGANICRRYKDRVLTNEPLWPWPMNQRIIDAMRESGRTPVDVTKTVESMFGSISSSCKGGGSPVASGSTGTPPKAPISLIVDH